VSHTQPLPIGNTPPQSRDGAHFARLTGPHRAPAPFAADRGAVSARARPATFGGPPSHLRYGVGLRVFKESRLLGQIRNEIVSNVMQPAEIAELENVTPEVLIALLDLRLARAPESGTLLRQFAASRAGFQVAAWRTTRKHPSRLHILDSNGLALCGTPPGAKLVAVHSGPCLTCAGHAGLDLTGRAQAA
jgi:hypothetical protein